MIGPLWKRFRVPLILAFLVWHFSGVLLWLSPDSALKQKLIPPFISYLNFFGMWQGWSVFEKPRTYNEYVTADLIYRDGSKKAWEFPRMEKMNAGEKMFKEGFRRWGNDCVSDTAMSYLWPDATRYVARINSSVGNPVVSVAIVRHWVWIESPETGLDKPLHTADDGSEILCTRSIPIAELE